MRIQFQPQNDDGIVRVDTVEIELTWLIRRGRSTLLFEGTLGDQRCVVKIPAKHDREQLDCGWALTPLPASWRLDLASFLGHSTDRYAYAAII
jgi:hypothetical protein